MLDQPLMTHGLQAVQHNQDEVARPRSTNDLQHGRDVTDDPALCLEVYSLSGPVVYSFSGVYTPGSMHGLVHGLTKYESGSKRPSMAQE